MTTRKEVIGYATGGFFGGRAEGRIVRTPAPIVYADLNSTYPLVNALLGTWEILRAARIEHRGVTRQVRKMLADPELPDRLYQRSFWHDEIGVTVVLLEPNGAILPVRGPYDARGADDGIGVNPLVYHGFLPYVLPDVIAAVLLGNSPKVIRAIRIVPIAVQRGLRPRKLRGGREIDPRTQDPFAVMVEERRRLEQGPDRDEPGVRRQRDFFKVTGNSTAYGSLARFDRRELSAPVKVTVHGPDGPFSWDTETPEDAGPYCEPAVAASITAGARLLVAMLERALIQA